MSLARPLDAAHAPPAGAAPAQTAVGVRSRLDAIDLLRGLVMIVMALDHTRDFFGASGFNPRDVGDPALFLTRWITHYCAPIFVFLAGISAWLYGVRGRSTGEVSRYLFTRGFWLLVLEFTIVRFGWTFDPGFGFLVGNVLWAIGVSMVVMAGLVWLPRAAIAVIGLVMIAGHNLLDGVVPADLGAAGWLWTMLHEGGTVPLSGSRLYVLYPLVPWIGVLAAGYALGPVYQWEGAARRRLLYALGAAVMLGFVLLRASNSYGDPATWQAQDSALATVLSFINAEKYPPSLLYLMMTLGPALVLLAAFEGVAGRIADWITVFGRVPLLFYVAHIYLLHVAALLMVLLTYPDPSWILSAPPAKPADYGLPLPGVYLVWLAAVAVLYPLVRWFAAVKQRRREWWLSYL